MERDAEILRMRSALRDLVAVSTIPVAWVGREPRDVAAGVADVLIGSLCIDFAFVRLCDPAGGAPVEVTRGNAWKDFPDWLRRYRAGSGRSPRKEIVPDVGGADRPCRGLVVPIGVDAEGGVVAAACGRGDFPSEVDQLLVSVAANHAATAFQNARVEEGLRQARVQLETKVADRTAELRQATAELRAMLDERERLLTSERAALAERRAHLWFLESMDRVNRAIQGTNDLEQMMSDVLDEVLSIFDCDRAWLVHPCDPQAKSVRALMEHTRPEFPGAFAAGREIPMDSDVVELFEAMKASDAPIQSGPGSGRPVPAEAANLFRIQSQISMAVRPKGGTPYVFGLHQCSRARVWTPQEERLFQEIGRRLADALTSLLILHDLRQSEARLEEAQRIAHVGYWERNLDTNHVTWSDETYRIFGLSPGSVDFAGFQELIHPEDRQVMRRATGEAERGGPRYDVEYRVVRPSGEARIVHSQGDVRKDQSGRARTIFGIIQDITERKRAEAEVRESEQRYRYIFQSTGVSIWEEDFSRVEDAIGDLKARGVRDFGDYCGRHPEFVEWAIGAVKIVDVNDATLELFGARSKAEMLSSLHEVFLPETVGVFVAELIAIAEGRTTFEGETVLRTLKGDRLTVLVTITFPPPARLDHVLVTLMDITGRKRAEHEHMLASEALRQAQADLAHFSRVTTMGELTASLAHEINQPIAAAITNANTCLRWLSRSPPDVGEAREAAARMVKDGRRAADIINRIRLLFKKGATPREPVDVNEVIEEMIVLLRSEARRHSVPIRADLTAGLPKVKADRVQLQQVFMNLMLNGIDAMKSNGGTGELTIRSEQAANGGLLISVSDAGVGLPPNHADEIFDAFFTTKPTGTGMGLPISRSIIESHGGRLWAAANAGPGATFQFTLPDEAQDRG